MLAGETHLALELLETNYSANELDFLFCEQILVFSLWILNEQADRVISWIHQRMWQWYANWLMIVLW